MCVLIEQLSVLKDNTLATLKTRLKSPKIRAAFDTCLYSFLLLFFQLVKSLFLLLSLSSMVGVGIDTHGTFRGFTTDLHGFRARPCRVTKSNNVVIEHDPIGLSIKMVYDS